MWRALWWLLWLILLAAAVASLGFAIYIELVVRVELKDWGWGLSYATYPKYIYGWKRWIAWLSVAGAGLLFLAYLLRPWGRGRRDCDQDGQG